MEEMSISKFRTTCLAVFKKVRKTKKPVLITRFGKPFAQIAPPPIPERPADWLGAMAGSGRVVGDIVSPAAEERDWDALRR